MHKKAPHAGRRLKNNSGAAQCAMHLHGLYAIPMRFFSQFAVKKRMGIACKLLDSSGDHINAGRPLRCGFTLHFSCLHMPPEWLAQYSCAFSSKNG
jgi:hypothetical protein